jgi:hypothetical protein
MSNKSIKIEVDGVTKSYALEELGTAGGGVEAGDIVEAVYDYLEKNPVEELADNSFYARYGVTTSAEIEAAHTAGKKLYCLKGDAICPLYERYDSNTHCFYRGGFYIYCIKNAWSESCPYDVSTNKVTEITEKSTDEQYPSAKAVYDILNEQKSGMELIDSATGDTYRLYVDNNKLAMEKVESEV